MASAGRKPGPTDPKRALTVARLRALGSTQLEAAEIAGVSEATVGRWERSDWWQGYAEQACDVIDDQVVAYALRTVLQAVRDGDASMARWVLERRATQRYGPPLQRSHVTGGMLPDDVLRGMSDDDLERLAKGEPLTDE